MHFLALRNNVDAMIPLWAQVMWKPFSIFLTLIRVIRITILARVQHQIGWEPVDNFWLFIICKVVQRLRVVPLICGLCALIYALRPIPLTLDRFTLNAFLKHLLNRL